MKNFWQVIDESKLKLNPDALLYKAIPQFFMEIMAKYFRLQIEGVEHLPKTGSALIAPNHSGYAGLDAMLLSYVIHQKTGRLPQVLTHRFWFLSKATAVPANRLGFVDATKANGIKHLKNKEIVVLFPEGEFGNFKPSTKAYRLQEFKRGFVRMAIKTGAPIVPTIVIGAEETHINLSQLKFSKYLRGLILPLPLNILPLPAKWKIRFLEPIRLPYNADATEDSELVHEVSADLRERMQAAINEELRKRDSIYF